MTTQTAVPDGYPTIAAIAAKTREIAMQRPAVVYQRLDLFNADHGQACVYVERNAGGSLVPSCLLGHAMVALGVPPRLLAEDRFEDGSDILQALNLLGYKYDGYEPVVGWLEVAQMAQDSGAPWGEAVAKADAQLYHYGTEAVSA